MKLFMWLETSNEKELSKENGYNVTLPITRSKTLDESLDTGHFQFRCNNKTPIEPFTKCKIVDDANKTSYWFAHSQPRSINLLTNRYIHDVYLMEPTKLLERHILGARAFSSGSSYFKSNKELINLILETCYPTREGQINPLYDSGSPDYIYFDDQGREEFSRDAKEYFFPEGTTLFEALETIGKSINAFPRMTDFHTLTFDFYNGTTEADISLLDSFEKTGGYNLDQYCGSIHSVVNNAIDLNRYEIAPSKDRSMTLRSETVRITDSTSVLKLEKPIYKINKLILKSTGEVLAKVATGSSGSSAFYYPPILKDIDLTKYVYEEREFQLLENDATMASGVYASLCYKMGDCLITNFNNYNKYFYGWIPGNTSLMNIITKVIRENPLSYTGQDVSKDSIAGVVIKEEGTNCLNCQFYVEYIPIETLSVKLYNDKKANNSLLVNPSSNIIDINYYGENLKATIEKLGNEENALSFKTKSLLLPNPGEKVGNYYISKVDSEYYNYYSKVKIELVKNYNKICEDVGIDSQLRLYAIPEDNVVERIIHIDTFCLVDGTKKENISSDLTYTSLEQIKTTVHYSITSSLMYVSKIKQDDYCIIKPISKYRIANSIILSFGFDNNSIGGYYKDGDYNRAIRYTDAKGEKDTLEFKVYNKIASAFNSNLYPKHSYFEDSNEVGSEIKTIDCNIVNLKKDARETIKVCYQIHFISQDENIILGNAFFKYNGLITDLNKGEGLTNKINMYVTFFKEPKYNKDGIINLDSNSHQLNGLGGWNAFSMDESGSWINFKCTGSFPTTYKCFVLTNEKGEILLIVNNIKEQNPIYFNLSNSYN